MSEASAKLIVVGGPLDGQEFPLEAGAERTLGSDADCSPRLELGNVAPHHARLAWKAGSLVLVDEGSATGTFVNGEQLAGERTLEEGDRICLGPPGSSQTAKILLRLTATVPAVTPAVAPSPPTESPAVLRFSDEESVSLVPVPESESGLGMPELEMPSAEPAPALVLPPPAAAEHPAEAEPEIVVSESEVAPAAAAPLEGKPAVSPKAAMPAPSAPTPPAPRPARPEYQKGPPSIVAESRPRPSVPVAAAAPRRRPSPRRARLRVPRIVLLAGATAGLCVAAYAAFVAYSRLPRPAPVLRSAPAKTDTGAIISIEGSGFAPEPAANTVRIADQTAKVVEVAATRLSVEVPDVASARARITVEVRGATSNALTIQIAPIPRVTALVPDVALPGQEITLQGTRLGGASPTVTVANVPGEILESQPEAIRVRIPNMPADDGRVVPVVVRIGDESSRPVNLTLGRLPLLTDVTPRRGLPGDRVTLKGRGFAPDPAGNEVTVGGQPALILKAQPTEITMLIPPGNAQMGNAPVVVRVGDSSSTARPLGIDVRSMAIYVPRFFAAAVPEHAGHGHVLVSTDMAPVLVLSDKADAASTVERAEKLATTLNSLVEAQLRGEAVSLEPRDSPSGVAVAGSKIVLVTATARDAAAYGEVWDPAVRPTSPSPREVARYWTALLQDYFTLFVARQRPTHVVELSTRGRALLDLYAEASRRTGPGNGVPNSLVTAPGALLAKSLRDMALLLPSGATVARVNSAIEGIWDGRMRENDLTRSVQLQLQSESGRLAGTLTIRKGALAMRAPLSAARYERGALTFTVTVSGEQRQFRGTLDGARLAGSIHASTGRGEKVGEFSLRYTD